MIKDYEIRKVNGEDTLYLYFDFGSEFAKLKDGEKKKKLKETIREYLKEKKIKFDGKKIAIVSSGLVIATLVMKTPSINYNSYTKRGLDYQNAVVLLEDDMPSLKESEKQPEKDQIQYIVDENKSSQETKPTAPGSNNTTSTNTNKNTTVSKPSTPSTGNTTSTAPITNVQEKPVEQTPVDNNVYVTVKRSNGSIIKVELEEYVIGVVGAEMPAAFDSEALKAQAVIARTYAMRALERGTILTDNSSTQNYKTNDQLRTMWGSGYQTYYNKIKNAVVATKGIYLTYNGSIIDAVYHSTSNGRTEDSKYVWGNAFPYLVSVDSPYDSSNPTFTTDVFFSYGDLSSKLGIEVNAETNFEIVSRTSGNRVEKLRVNGVEFTGVQVRSKLGLKSADFDIISNSGGFTFTTRGFGHGVGLSQYGANGMAKAGSDYITILKHYYKGVTLSHL